MSTPCNNNSVINHWILVSEVKRLPQLRFEIDLRSIRPTEKIIVFIFCRTLESSSDRGCDRRFKRRLVSTFAIRRSSIRQIGLSLTSLYNNCTNEIGVWELYYLFIRYCTSSADLYTLQQILDLSAIIVVTGAVDRQLERAVVYKNQFWHSRRSSATWDWTKIIFLKKFREVMNDISSIAVEEMGKCLEKNNADQLATTRSKIINYHTCLTTEAYKRCPGLQLSEL